MIYIYCKYYYKAHTSGLHSGQTVIQIYILLYLIVFLWHMVQLSDLQEMCKVLNYLNGATKEFK